MFNNRTQADEYVNGSGTTTTKSAYHDAGTVFADLTSGNTMQTRYVHQDDSQYSPVMARVESGAAAWLLADRLGSTRNVVNGSGTLVGTVAYDAFGGVTSESDSTKTGRFTFTGLTYQRNAGQLEANKRVYNPSTGRWMQEDPIRWQAGDVNLGRYVGNGPTNGTDLSGKLAIVQAEPFRLYDDKGDPVGTWTDVSKPVQALATFRLTNINCKMKELDPKTATPDADCVIGKLTVKIGVDRRWRLVDGVKVGREGPNKEFNVDDPRNFHSILVVRFTAEAITGPKGCPKQVEFTLLSRPLKGKYFGIDNVGVFIQQHKYDVRTIAARLTEDAELRRMLNLPDIKSLKTLSAIIAYTKTYIKFVETNVRPGPIESGKEPGNEPAYPK